MQEHYTTLRQEAIAAIAAAETMDAVEALRVHYFGKKGVLTVLLASLKDLAVEEKRVQGPVCNAIKQEIMKTLDARRDALLHAQTADAEWIDVTMAPHMRQTMGHPHPLSVVQRDIERIFTSMGFGIADGPEIETEFYNFDAVNMPDDHPGRDMQDTFWIRREKDRAKGSGIVLRTQTSSVQVRYMQTHTPPFRVIVPGRVYRNEATDTTHEHTFHQFEALVVGDDVNVAHFLDIAQKFFTAFFGMAITVRLRPSYFPFVEPGFEFDISCTRCGGSGCGACKHTGWLEVGGAGMVHQNVFVAAGYPEGRYTGFAWGFGLERLAMMRYKIEDIRLFHSGDVRVSEQFS